MILVIVESPTKAAAIGQYLGKNYKVMASRGHIREIRHNPFGVDVDDGFRTTFEYTKEAEKVVAQLKKEAEKADEVLLASDPDREGEAIAWHLCDVLGIDPYSDCRFSYHEVNHDAVAEALQNPRPIDMDLVDAALTRSVLDYLVGFTVSPILWQKYCKGLSAGRVQSAALYLICEREKKRSIELAQNTEPTHFTVDAKMQYQDVPFTIISKKLDQKEGEKVFTDTQGKPFVLDQIERSKEKSTAPAAPFKTSTLIRSALTNLGFGADMTMQIAQSLFEGKKIGGEVKGLITYMRTDAVYISEKFQEETRHFLQNEFGDAYVPAKVRKYKASGNAQEAHEAVRPTDLSLTPEKTKQYLSDTEYKLYKMIYGRYLASQMTPSRSVTVTYSFMNSGYTFACTDTEYTFDGFRKVYNYSAKKEIPAMKEGLSLSADEILLTPHFKAITPHFNQASLVEYMERCGIGRPSTYASTIKTLIQRGYVELDGKALLPRDLGNVVNDALQKSFPGKFSVKETEDGFISFTADLEEHLDQIAEGEADREDELTRFWESFVPLLDQAKVEMPKYVAQETDLFCPKCGSRLLKRLSKSGLFLGCGNYPACTYTSEILDFSDELCKECGQPMVKRHRKSGSVYHVCANPSCGNCKVKTEDDPPLKEQPQNDWKKNIIVSNKAVSLTKLGRRIETAASAAEAFESKFNGQNLKNKLAREGFLELREDQYGNKGYLPTEKGIALGMKIEERSNTRNPQGKMEIATLERSAQQYVVENLI